MTKLDDARKVWERKISQYRKSTERRTAYTGDGNGTAASNFYFPYGGNNQFIWVRTPDNLDNPFPVLNRGVVRPAVNVPVWLGTTEIEPEREQVIGINYDAFNVSGGGGSTIEGVGAHHQQHEWNGGDEVFIDPRQFNYALVHPTNPPSMRLTVKAFTYFLDEWRRVDEQTTLSLSAHVPSSGTARYVLISYDPIGEELVYTIGGTFASGTFPSLLSPGTLQDNLPAPKFNHFPLAFVLLRNTTASLNWDTELADARRHINTGMVPARTGEVVVGTPDGYFEPLIPLTEEAIGQQLMDEQSGYLLYS